MRGANDELIRRLLREINDLKRQVEDLAALESGGGSGAEDFLGLDDTPSAYTSQAGKLVRVNATPNGLEFVAQSDLSHTGFGDIGTNSHSDIDDHIADTNNPHAVDYTQTGAAAAGHDHDSDYAPLANGVTNGDSHDHSGGDGAQIDHTTLSNIGTNSHATIDSHIAATTAHGITGNVVGTTDTQTLSSKTIVDNSVLMNQSDTMKTSRFNLAGITAGAERTMTIPDADGTLALINVAQTWSATPIFSSGISLGNETLSHYDEGSWTPAIQGSGSNPTVAYTNQAGDYTRIGRMVAYNIFIKINTISGGSGDVRVTLPFTAAVGSLGMVRVSGVDLPGTPVAITFIATTAGAFGAMHAVQDNGALQAVQISGLANGDEIRVTGFMQL